MFQVPAALFELTGDATECIYPVPLSCAIYSQVWETNILCMAMNHKVFKLEMSKVLYP